MNKIFKVVWSKVKHCYVVVSEIAKNTISGGARRCRVRKGALAVALVTTVLGSSFVMPEGALAANYGNSYEAMVVLSATANENGTSLGITLYRGDKYPDTAKFTYLKPEVAKSALGNLYDSGYSYTKVESSATAEFNKILNQTITQTVVTDIVAMIEKGENVYISGDGTGENPYVINAIDTKNESVSLSINDDNELVVSVTDVNKDGRYSKSASISIDELKAKIDTDTVTRIIEGSNVKVEELEADEAGNAGYKISATNNYVKGASVAYDANGYEGTLTIEREGLDALEIKGLKNTYTTGVSVEDSDNVADVNFARNDGTEGYGVSFVGEGSVNVSADEDGKKIFISAVDTRNESVSLSVNDKNELVVNVTETDGTDSKTISSNAISLSAIDTDTVTRIVEGSNVKVEELEADEAGNAGYKISATNNYVKGASVSYDDEGYEGTLNIEREGLDALEIKGLKDTYTTGVSVSGNDVVFNRNDGSSYGMNFIADGGKLNAQGKPEDTYVQVSAGNEAVIKLNTGSKVSANENKEYQANQVLEDITINGQKYTLGYSWGLQVEGDKGNTGNIEVNNGQTLRLAEGENVQLDYADGTITISAMVKAEGKYADWQNPATRGVAASDVTGLKQLSKLTVDGEEFSIPTINEVINPDSDAPLLKAVELNGKEYRIADPAWTVKVANGDAVSSFDVTDGDAVEYVAGSNIVLSAETTKDENDGVTGGRIVVTTAKDVVFDSVTVGGNVVINNSGIAMGNQKITGLEAGVADTDAVNVSQLRDVVTSSITANEQHLVVNPDSQDGKYKVDGNTVTLKVQGKDANGGTVYTDVVIDDVASAEYVDNKFDAIEGEINGLDNRITVVEDSIVNINQNIANAKTEVEAGSNITVVEDEIDGGGKKYTISATDTNTVNQHMEGTGWVAGSDGKATDDLLIKVNDSDGKSVEATIKDVAKASDLKQEVKDRQEADSVLAGAIINNQQNVQNLNAGLSKLGNRMNKVGAGSAALAALHPMDFDPDDKLQFSAGVGHYGGENAAALGAFYRPTEKVMFSVAGTMGNGEDMVNAGVTFALDKPNNVSNSRTAMAREIVDLREHVARQEQALARQDQQIAQLVAMVNQLTGNTMSYEVNKDIIFPDIPENHWAYEYIHSLAAKGIIEGYPDGNFGGDRTMTRYEFATMLFKAMQKGAVLSEQIRQEFNAELGRISVDRIKGADNDANKIERVRVNNYEDRDDYGSKIVQVKAGA